ncbi:hypothetical protein SSBG_00213 [Streptomyces sp. SPB074]|nr:hypothetical protein SSBG_00213 [Streptomyces sp. SPB074]
MPEPGPGCPSVLRRREHPAQGLFRARPRHRHVQDDQLVGVLATTAAGGLASGVRLVVLVDACLVLAAAALIAVGLRSRRS